MAYYFAYGSNMDKYQIEDRCPNRIEIGKGLIPNKKIDFTRKSINRNCGVADIVDSQGDVVWGIIYDITDGDFISLDRVEGYPNYYTKKIVKCYQFVDPNPWGFIPDVPLQEYYEELYENPFNFKEIDTVVYEVIDKSASTIQPSIEYLHLLQGAADENFFPMDYQEKLNAFGAELRIQLNSQALDLFLEISDLIATPNFNEKIEDTQEFGGADLVITGSLERKQQLNENYPLDLVVLTPFWKELSWVVTHIYYSESTKWLFNSFNKYIYFKEFGEAAIEYQSKNPNDKDHIGICRAGIAKAYSLLTEGGILFVD
jgi:hypothetical protein